MRSETSKPSIFNSPWTRGAPQLFSVAILRIRSRISASTAGRPVLLPRREIQFQYSLKPARCHAAHGHHRHAPARLVDAAGYKERNAPGPGDKADWLTLADHRHDDKIRPSEQRGQDSERLQVSVLAARGYKCIVPIPDVAAAEKTGRIIFIRE